jgi:hypothetical protein
LNSFFVLLRQTFILLRQTFILLRQTFVLLIALVEQGVVALIS